MNRDRADRGLTEATERATEAVAGIVEDGPVRFVNDEIRALTQRAESAEAQARRWKQVGTALSDLRERETALREQARAAEQAAMQRVEQVRAEVAEPLASAAGAALTEWQDTEATAEAAGEQVQAVSWFGKRRARTDHETAQARARQARQRLTDEWGGVPKSSETPDAWVERVTAPTIDADPRVTEAEREHRAARDVLVSRPEQAQAARLAAYARVFGTQAVLRNRQTILSTNPARRAAQAVQTAKQARAEAELLGSLTPAEAVARIEQTRTEQAGREAQKAEQERASLHTVDQQPGTPRREGPGLGL